MQNKAIILGTHYNGLSIIQELGSQKIPCVAADTWKSIGTFSKYANYLKVPNPLTDDRRFIGFLYDFCSKEKLKPILFPTNDHWASALSKYKQELQSVSTPVVAEWDVMDTLLKKRKFYELGKERNYLTPRNWTKEDIQLIDDSDFPIIAKPEYRRLPNSGIEKKDILDSKRFTLLENRSQLNDFFTSNKSMLDYFLFQEYIYGLSNQMYTVGIYADDNSDILGIFSGRKVRGYPAAFGDWVVGENHQVPDTLIDLTYKITKDLKYKGIAEFEFKYDIKRKEYRLIEINPRSWSWVGITGFIGIGFATLAYNDKSKGQKLYSNSLALPSGTVRYLKLFEDLDNCINKYKIEYEPWNYGFIKWLKKHRGKKTIYVEFAKFDLIIPFIAAYRKMREIMKR